MNHSIGINDFNSICRICLIKKDDMITYFSPMTIYMLEYCTSVLEKDNKKLPQQLCKDCYAQLKSAFHFKEQYLLSVGILRGIVAESEQLVEIIVEIIDETDDEETENKIECETEETNKNSIVDGNINEESLPITVESNGDESTKCDSDSERSNNNSPTEEIFRNIEETIKKKKKKRIRAEYTCDICGKRVQKLLRHQRNVHSNIKSFECDICHKKLRHEFSIIKHKRRMHENINKENTPKDLCFICGKLSAHMTSHLFSHEQKKLKCDKCGKTFKNKSTLRLHYERKHSGNTPRRYFCKICDKSFEHLSSLKLHIQLIHSDETKCKYICKLCDRSFRLKSHLCEHIKAAHVNERPYNCTVCDKTFNIKRKFLSHMRTHADERPCV